eukprot:TRINITY_DN3738_c0_g1_i2.p2 TRINITY_DN3738_c0_g1~~TRINITY_DN3738_c0_g1_i2.p2  ORF type:complete len:387 (+),score=81.92 TRINITY_DN3738_c0_g1_i2:83-1243(+)
MSTNPVILDLIHSSISRTQIIHDLQDFESKSISELNTYTTFLKEIENSNVIDVGELKQISMNVNDLLSIHNSLCNILKGIVVSEDVSLGVYLTYLGQSYDSMAYYCGHFDPAMQRHWYSLRHKEGYADLVSGLEKRAREKMYYFILMPIFSMRIYGILLKALKRKTDKDSSDYEVLEEVYGKYTSNQFTFTNEQNTVLMTFLKEEFPDIERLQSEKCSHIFELELQEENSEDPDRKIYLMSTGVILLNHDRTLLKQYSFKTLDVLIEGNLLTLSSLSDRIYLTHSSEILINHLADIMIHKTMKYTKRSKRKTTQHKSKSRSSRREIDLEITPQNITELEKELDELRKIYQDELEKEKGYIIREQEYKRIIEQLKPLINSLEELKSQ